MADQHRIDVLTVNVTFDPDALGVDEMLDALREAPGVLDIGVVPPVDVSMSVRGVHPDVDEDEKQRRLRDLTDGIGRGTR